MENIGYHFYKKYYTGTDLRKFSKKEDRDKINKENEKVFKNNNQELLKISFATSLNEHLSHNSEHRFSLKTTYPGLLIGSGYTHETGSLGELKLGFFFDYTTGLPIIPGSSIKGVLRSIFPQFQTEPNDKLKIKRKKVDERALLDFTTKQRAKALYIWQLLSKHDNVQFPVRDALKTEEEFNKIHHLELQIFEGVDLIKTKSAREIYKDKRIEYASIYRRDIFNDAFITQSFKHGGKILGDDFITPHKGNPLKNPIPLQFLKVLPDVSFEFQFILKGECLINAGTKLSLFQQILLDLGIGAKTNVGYGRLKA